MQNYPQQPHTNPYPVQPVQEVNATAKWALWVGAGSFLCWFGAPIAALLALVARSEINKQPGRYSNGSQATVGLVLGSVGTALLIGFFVFRFATKDDPKWSPPAKVAAAEPRANAEPTPEPKPTSEPALDVTAAELFEAYEANEVAADARFKDKTLEVTGLVEGIDKDFLDNAVVKLRTKNQFMSVMAYGVPMGVAGALVKGQSVTFTCRGAGRTIGSPVVRGCK
jgi:hypothetical protein